ncbi:MAG: hypothetical protein EOO73_16620 [Myxococcales bacterium]|nr:MAG: hypothetical protein EOO73_16620 [Myxococcales bacterium]
MGTWALGLFTIGCAIIVSCGGSSDDDDGDGSTAGTSSTSGSSTGGSSTAGTSSSGGSGASAGTSSGGTAAGGMAAGGSEAGGAPPSGGGDGPDFPGGGEGPTFPGAGGAGSDECPATEPEAGEACTLPRQVDCDYAETTCNCVRQGGQGQGMRVWECGDGTTDGAGGQGGGPGFGQAECPDDAQDDDECTGTGLCTGQQCFCVNDTVNCF